MSSSNHTPPTMVDLYTTLHNRKRRILDEDTYRKNAVLVPLLQTPDGITILFEKRAKTLRRQAGEICFPGGHVEPTDPDERFTAVRETSEELRIPLTSIQVMAELDYLVTPMHMIIYPFVGSIDHPKAIEANPDEVEYTFTVPLQTLLETPVRRHDVALSIQPDETFPFHMIPGGKQYAWRVGHVPELFYEVDSHIIWGLTARILHHFLEQIRESPIS